jgi:ubiquinone/menaquinone biosynthesis C-methylase UbiE
MAIMTRPTPYVPALRFDWLTRFYDPILRATLQEEPLKRRLVEQVDLRPGQRALDLGCGTATLTIMLARACPEAEVVGLDGDPRALAIGRDKVTRAGLRVELHEGVAQDAPFPPASFDRVVSSLVFHHLDTDTKRAALARARELLRAGGELHVLDWGRAESVIMRLAFLPVQLLDGFGSTGDNVRGRLPALIAEAGFEDVAETHRARTMLGVMSLYRAVRP